jgi:hypothetical protein
MKNFLLIFFLLFYGILFSQDKTNNKALVKQGSFVVDAYYGVGTITGALVKAINTSTSSSSTSAGLIGPIGGRFEYMLSDVIAIGLDVQYSKFKISWKEVNANPPPSEYNYKIEWIRIRYLPKISFHFGGNEKTDGYASIFGGWMQSDFRVTSNDTTYTGKLAWPSFSFRIAVGARHFFNPHLGIFGELGAFGGGVFHGGITFRF